MNRSANYEIIESKCWVNLTTGDTASIYGSVPYLSDAEKNQWTIQTVGFTVRNKKDGTVGIGRQPWKTREEVQVWLESLDLSNF